MAQSSIQVLLEIEHGSAIKRWLSTALVPLGEHPPPTVDVSGEAVIAKSERKTRSSEYLFSPNSNVKGKSCVCESFDEMSANEAMLFANKVGAQALLVTHEPDVAVTIPTIVISQEESEYIKGLPASMISAVYISGSYKVINVTLRTQRMTTESDQSFQWKSKMFVPTSLIEKTISGLDFRIMIDTAPFVFRDGDSYIASGDDCFSRKICLFNAVYPGDANRAVEIATEYGASALFICCKETLDWSRLTLPALAIDRDQLEDLKKAGLSSGDLGVNISYDKDVALVEDNKLSLFIHRRTVLPSNTPTEWPPLPRESRQTRSSRGLGVAISNEEYGAFAEEKKPSSFQPGRNDDRSSNVPSKWRQVPKEVRQTKRAPPESKGIWGLLDKGGELLNKGGEFVNKAFHGYSPKSREEFDEIVCNGTSWSCDGPNSTSFCNAMNILDRIRRLRSSDDQEEEIKLLINTIHVMTVKENIIGDVLVILLCAHIFPLKADLRINVSTSKLDDAMVAMVHEITIDPEVPKLLTGEKNRTILDQCIVRLTMRIFNWQSNMSNHTVFVLNALWVRSYHCEALADGTWVGLKRVTSLKHIESGQETILSFMEPIKFNTLLTTSIAHKLHDICRIFHGDMVVPILPIALGKLQEIYERNQLQRWIENNGDLRELTVLNLIGRLMVRDRRESAKEAIICSVIKRASFESVNTFRISTSFILLFTLRAAITKTTI